MNERLLATLPWLLVLIAVFAWLTFRSGPPSRTFVGFSLGVIPLLVAAPWAAARYNDTAVLMLCITYLIGLRLLADRIGGR